MPEIIQTKQRGTFTNKKLLHIILEAGYLIRNR